MSTLARTTMAFFTLALTAPFLGSGAAQAQNGNSGVAELRADAEALYTAPRAQWGRVVALHEQAARMAPLDDPGRVEDLWMAGTVSAGLGRQAEAAALLSQAGEAALEFGDLFRAGHAFVLAAYAAAKAGDLDTAKHLRAHAVILAESTLLPADLCDCLRQRVALLDKLGF